MKKSGLLEPDSLALMTMTNHGQSVQAHYQTGNIPSKSALYKLPEPFKQDAVRWPVAADSRLGLYTPERPSQCRYTASPTFQASRDEGKYYSHLFQVCA